MFETWVIQLGARGRYVAGLRGLRLCCAQGPIRCSYPLGKAGFPGLCGYLTLSPQPRIRISRFPCLPSAYGDQPTRGSGLPGTLRSVSRGGEPGGWGRDPSPLSPSPRPVGTVPGHPRVSPRGQPRRLASVPGTRREPLGPSLSPHTPGPRRPTCSSAGAGAAPRARRVSRRVPGAAPRRGALGSGIREAAAGVGASRRAGAGTLRPAGTQRRRREGGAGRAGGGGGRKGRGRGGRR